MKRTAAQIEKRKIDLGTFIVATRGRLTARMPESSRPLAMARSGVPETIKGLEFHNFVRLGIGRDDFFDRENFHGAPAGRRE